MPLDIQPLSPQRQALMLVVLMALFGASLAFAQVLVNSRRIAMPEVVTIIRPPEGMTEPVRGLESLPGVVLSGAGRLEGRPRWFVAFSYEGDSKWTTDSAQAEAIHIFQMVLGEPVEDQFSIASAVLGRLGGYQLEGEFGVRDDRHFLLERMSVLPGRVVAICFSGPGRLTDADREFFNEFCNTRVSIRLETPRTPTTRPQ